MKILYQDGQIIVCIKPSGIVSTDEPGGMPERIRKAIGEDAAVWTVHRLDAVVSGLMVFALTKEAASALSAQIIDGTFMKEYMAVTQGVPAEPTGELHDYLHRDRAERKTYAVSTPGRDTQEAILRYRVCESTNERSLVRITLVTGRTHQIRAQFSSRGLTLFGDRKYGSRNETGRLALWSCHLTFRHPVTGQTMDFSAMAPTREPWTDFSEVFFADYAEEDVIVEYERPKLFANCHFADTCNGCAFQGMEYGRQLEKKQKLIAKALGQSVPPLAAAEQPFGYKHKTTWDFFVKQNRQITCTSRFPGSKGSCMLNHEKAAEIAETLRSLMEQHKICGYKKGGRLATVMLRISTQSRDVMLTISAENAQIKAVLQQLQGCHSEIKTVIWKLNGKEETLFGPGYIEDQLLGLRFRIFPKTAFPINPVQSEKACRAAIEFAALSGNERVLDLCGGRLGLFASGSAKRVICVDRVEGALKEIKDELKRNRIQNVKAVRAEPDEYIEGLTRSREQFDVVFSDGLCRGRFPTDGLGRLSPERIVLVADAPEKLAQAIKTLATYGYRVQRVESFDTMPFTPLAETVVLLRRQEDPKPSKSKSRTRHEALNTILR